MFLFKIKIILNHTNKDFEFVMIKNQLARPNNGNFFLLKKKPYKLKIHFIKEMRRKSLLSQTDHY